MADEAAEGDVLACVLRGDLAGLAAALSAGGDADQRDPWGASALSRAAGRGDLAAVRLLLQRGAQPDLANDVGNTALMLAATQGDPEVLTSLLAAGADPRAKNRWGLGPEDWAKWAPDPAEVRVRLSAAREAP